MLRRPGKQTPESQEPGSKNLDAGEAERRQEGVGVARPKVPSLQPES